MFVTFNIDVRCSLQLLHAGSSEDSHGQLVKKSEMVDQHSLPFSDTNNSVTMMGSWSSSPSSVPCSPFSLSCSGAGSSVAVMSTVVEFSVELSVVVVFSEGLAVVPEEMVARKLICWVVVSLVAVSAAAVVSGSLGVVVVASFVFLPVGLSGVSL